MLVMGTRRNRGGGTREVVRDYTPRGAIDEGHVVVPDGAVECGGRIGVSIGADLDGPTDNPYADFRLEFPCERCGCRHHPGLPNTDTIGPWIADAIAAIPDAPTAT
jgi:hypothetical protein